MKDLRKLSRNGLAIIVGTFFFLGGIGKLISPDVAATFLSDATDLSLAFAVAIMYAVATVELVIAVLIIFIPPYRALATLIACVLLTLFSVGSVLAESERECGCFGGLIESPQLWDLNSAMTSIIAVSLSEQAKLGDFLKRAPVSLLIALPSDMEEFKRQNKLSFVPLTFLVDQRFFPSTVLTLEY